MNAGSQTVALPIRGLERHLDPGFAHDGPTTAPILLLQFQTEAHLVLCSPLPLGMCLEILLGVISVSQQANALAWSQPFAFSQGRLALDGPGLAEHGVVAVLFAQP